MTDSIKTTLSLTKIAALVRMDVNAVISTKSNPWGEVKNRHTSPSFQPSAMSKTKTKWVVRCALDDNHPDFGLVPTHIDAELHIPNSTVGQNLEHGTSVWAAGVAAFEHQRIWMAQSGLPKAELDLLTTADVRMRGATITYLVRCPTPEEAVKMIKSIRSTGKVLVSAPNFDSHDSTNISVKLKYGTFTVSAYIKTNLKHCKFADGAPVDSLVAQALCIVRIEVTVGEVFLEKHNLLALDNWRDAYSPRTYKNVVYQHGAYEMIFDLAIRQKLRLGQLRHKAPREEVFQRLSPELGRLLQGYLDGRNPRQFQSVIGSKSPNKRFSALRLEILRVAKIDIDIPWVEHVKLRCFELDAQLGYPGDYKPSEAHTPWCFCRANWSELHRQLREKYESALSAAAFNAEHQMIPTGEPIPEPC